ncbi:hypothetical protein HWV62_22852 [Athelia sp. TMB]|nr:hypothetical protein HWV62_22852 [Athelia sp. TMB]
MFKALEQTTNNLFHQWGHYLVEQTRDTVIATINEQIPTIVDNVIANSPPRPSKPTRHARTSLPGGYDGDDDGDDHDDGPVTPSRRKGPKSTATNQLHEHMREHLRDERLLLHNPPCANPEDVQKFVEDNEGGPLVDKPVLIDWPSGPKSRWNQEAFFVLASSFKVKHETDMTVPELAKLFSRKLERSFQSYGDSQKKAPSDIAEAKTLHDTKQRRSGRRRHVCTFYLNHYVRSL